VILEEIAFERFKEVALGVEVPRQLPPDHLALSELLTCSWRSPSRREQLLQRFLEHTNAEVVAARIEATVEMGDTLERRELAS